MHTTKLRVADNGQRTVEAVSARQNRRPVLIADDPQTAPHTSSRHQLRYHLVPGGQERRGDTNLGSLPTTPF